MFCRIFGNSIRNTRELFLAVNQISKLQKYLRGGSLKVFWTHWIKTWFLYSEFVQNVFVWQKYVRSPKFDITTLFVSLSIKPMCLKCLNKIVGSVSGHWSAILFALSLVTERNYRDLVALTPPQTLITLHWTPPLPLYTSLLCKCSDTFSNTKTMGVKNNNVKSFVKWIRNFRHLSLGNFHWI